MTITDKEIEVFRTEGSVVVRGLLDDYWMGMLRKGYDEVVDSIPDTNETMKRDVGSNVRNLMKEGSSRESPSIARFLRESPAGPAVAAAMGSKVVRLYEDLLIVREAGVVQPSPWHQDTSHWPVTGSHLSSLWVSLDEATVQTGAMTMVVASHKGPLYTPGNTIPQAWKHLVEPEAGGPLPDVDAVPGRFNVKAYETNPGDVVIFHPSVLHNAPGTSRQFPRRTFTFRCLGDDVVWRWRNIVMQDHIRAMNMQDGDTLERSSFPIIWPPERQTL